MLDLSLPKNSLFTVFHVVNLVLLLMFFVLLLI